MRLLASIALLAAAPAVAATPAQGGRELDTLVTFNSPSRNIGCQLTDVRARCDISKRDWSPPPKPSSCDGDFGQGLRVSRYGRRGRFMCAGDTALGGERVLADGRSLRRGRLTCTSRQSGITCRNRRGHGFRISRESYRIF